MPRIREYIAKPTLLHPSDAGFSAFETAGRRIGPLYHEAAAALEEQGKLKAQGLAEQITPFRSAERIEQARQDLLRAQAREAQLVAEGQVKLGSAGLPHISGSPVTGNGGFGDPMEALRRMKERALGGGAEDGNYGGGGDTATPAAAQPGLNSGLSASLDQVSQGAAGLATMLNTAVGGSHMVTVNNFAGPPGVDMTPDVGDPNGPNANVGLKGGWQADEMGTRIVEEGSPSSPAPLGDWSRQDQQTAGEWVKQFVPDFSVGAPASDIQGLE